MESGRGFRAASFGADVLRHPAASLAVSAGTYVKGIQRMLGHASAAVTLDVYSGLFDDDLDAVAERMDAAAARVPPVCPEGTSTTIEEPPATP